MCGGCVCVCFRDLDEENLRSDSSAQDFLFPERLSCTLLRTATSRARVRRASTDAVRTPHRETLVVHGEHSPQCSAHLCPITCVYERCAPFSSGCFANGGF